MLWDHAIGDNTTSNGGGTSAGDAGTYATLISSNNVAQQSWKAHWMLSPFDPTVDGTYDFMLKAFDGDGEVVSTSIQIIVGAGAPVPEPATIGLMALGLAGAGIVRRRRKTT